MRASESDLWGEFECRLPKAKSNPRQYETHALVLALATWFIFSLSIWAAGKTLHCVAIPFKAFHQWLTDWVPYMRAALLLWSTYVCACGFLFQQFTSSTYSRWMSLLADSSVRTPLIRMSNICQICGARGELERRGQVPLTRSFGPLLKDSSTLYTFPHMIHQDRRALSHS